MSNKRRARYGGKSRQKLIAERTSPAEGGLVHVDQTRTFMVEGAFMESMVNLKPIEGLVRLDLNGYWSRRVERLPDDPVLQLSAGMARELSQYLLEGADAAERDAEKWRREHAGGADPRGPVPE